MAKRLPPEVQAIISASDAGLHATTVKLVQEFVEANPTSQRAWIDLGHSLGHLARYDEAQAAFEKAIDLADEDPTDVIFGEIGHLYRSRGQFDDAASWYQKQIEADPTDSAGYVFLGNLRRSQGDTEAAIATLNKGLECEFGCREEVHYSLGLSLRNAGNMHDAKQQFEKAIAIDKKFLAAKTALKDVTRCTR